MPKNKQGNNGNGEYQEFDPKALNQRIEYSSLNEEGHPYAHAPSRLQQEDYGRLLSDAQEMLRAVNEKQLASFQSIFLKADKASKKEFVKTVKEFPKQEKEMVIEMLRKVQDVGIQKEIKKAFKQEINDIEKENKKKLKEEKKIARKAHKEQAHKKGGFLSFLYKLKDKQAKKVARPQAFSEIIPEKMNKEEAQKQIEFRGGAVLWGSNEELWVTFKDKEDSTVKTTAIHKIGNDYCYVDPANPYKNPETMLRETSLQAVVTAFEKISSPRKYGPLRPS